MKDNSTRLAELGTRSLGLQRAFPAEIRSMRTQTSICTTDMGTLQQWRSIQGAYWVELHRLQHRINFIIAQIGFQELGQQNVCPPMLSKVCRTESNPSRLTWTPWIAAAAQKLQLVLHRQMQNLRFQLHENRRQRIRSPPPWPLNTQSCLRASRRRTGHDTLRGDKKNIDQQKKLSRRCRHRPRRTSAKRGSGCCASPLAVTQLRKLPWMTSLLGRSALVLTESLDIIPRHICGTM